MARIDIIDDWSAATQTGSFTYADGQSVGYTYSTTGTLENPSTPSHIDDVALLMNGQTLNITFDQPAAGVSIAMGDYRENNEVTQLTVDGQIIEIDDWIADGRILVTGPSVSGDGSNLINANGDFYGGGNNIYNYITFVEPITSISMVTTATAGGAYHDILIEENAILPCFTLGTLIETDKGPVAVEDLQAGDKVRTKDHGFQPVQWVGGSRVHDAPVRISKGTFGNSRDLVVSPRHRMLLQGWQMGLLFNHDEAFAAAKDMQNGTTITMEAEGWVEYFHVLLERHEVIYAEGAETESFFPDEASLNSMAKKTREELAQTVDLSTFGRTVRPTLTANQAMYLSHNMDLLEDEPNQIAAQ